MLPTAPSLNRFASQRSSELLGTGLLVLAGALVMALVIDYFLGEPSERWHPVVWMGRYLDWAALRFAPQHESITDSQQNKRRVFWQGAMYWSLGAVVFSALFAGVELLARSLHPLIAVGLLGLALKPLLAMAMLCSEVAAVDAALDQSLAQGRERLSRLVSRDTQHLIESQVREAAIETLAENLNDSVVSPIFWFVLGGLPAAALYRFANTADAMWGYKGMRDRRDWRYAGKWAARADDVLSWPGARLTAAVVWLLYKGQFEWALLRQEARKTPSPNSGWPMAAFALALGIKLEKPGVYSLNADANTVLDEHFGQALFLARNVMLFVVFFALLAIILVANLDSM